MNIRLAYACALLMTPLLGYADDKPAPAPVKPATDLIALDTMARHHEATEIMARATAAQSTNKKIRALAQRVARTANTDSNKLKAWRERWYADAPRAIDGDAPGMAELQRQLTLLAEVPPDRLDTEFLDKMIRHCENGTRLGKLAHTRAQRTQIKNFARTMAAQQARELQQLRPLLAAKTKKLTEPAAR